MALSLAAQDAKRSAYERDVAKLLERARKVTEADLARIRGKYDALAARVQKLLPERFAMNQAAMQAALATVRAEIARLQAELERTIREGMAAQAKVAQDTTDRYASEFLEEGRSAPTIGITAHQLDIAADFSADLVGLREGGLGAAMLGQVNQVIRLAALGAGPGGFRAAEEIGRVLGARGWSARAEAIYRTETLRVHSLATENALRELNAITPTAKKWVWSRIARDEHAKANGQVVNAGQKFRVPRRNGGTAELAYPRDPGGPADAVINCGCYEIPVPLKRAPSSLPQPTPIRKRASKKSGPVEKFEADAKAYAARFKAGIKPAMLQGNPSAALAFRSYDAAFDLAQKEVFDKKFGWFRELSLKRWDTGVIQAWSGSSSAPLSIATKWSLRQSWGEKVKQFHFGNAGGLAKDADAIRAKLDALAQKLIGNSPLKAAMERAGITEAAAQNEQFWSFMDEYVRARQGFVRYYTAEDAVFARRVGKAGDTFKMYRGHGMSSAKADDILEMLDAENLYVPNAVSSWTKSYDTAKSFAAGHSNSVVFVVEQRADEVFGSWLENHPDRWRFGDDEAEVLGLGLRAQKLVPQGGILKLGDSAFPDKVWRRLSAAISNALPSKRAAVLASTLSTEFPNVWAKVASLKGKGWELEVLGYRV